VGTNQKGFGRVVIAGGSGFLGTSLARHLRPRCREIVVLTRGPDEPPCTGGRGNGVGIRRVHWDAATPGPWVRWLDGAAAVVNLVGRTVDCRKTPRNKREILDSRVNSVRALAAAYTGSAAVPAMASPPPVWVQSSTAHIYGDTADELLDESSPPGEGFAPDVGRAWEAALEPVLKSPSAPRVVTLRISFVLGRDGGALRTLARLARLGLGGTIGAGRQYISRIHELDLCRLVERAIVDERMAGVYVATAPNPLTNRDFMRSLRRAAHRPWSPPVPAPLVRLGSWLMRTDPELALFGRRCVPTRLSGEKFTFEFETVEDALRDLLAC
jgi:uncharacterized protein